MIDLEQNFAALITAGLEEPFKYLKSRHMIIKKNTDGYQAITVGLLRRRETGRVKVALNAHIRLNSIESQYLDLLPLISARDKQYHPTLVVSCDTLYTNRTLVDSILLSSDNIKEVAGSYTNAIKNDVVPFLNEFYSVDNLTRSLESAEPECRVTSDPNKRFWVLLSVYAMRGKWNEFASVSREYLDHCSKPAFRVNKSTAESIIEGLKKRYGQS